MDQPTNSQPLDYAPRPLGRHRKRILALVVLILSISLIGVIGYFWGTQIVRRVRILYLQHECMTYVAPTDKPICDTYAPNQSIIQPKSVIEILALALNMPAKNLIPGSIIFSHEVHASTGESFLVIGYGGTQGGIYDKTVYDSFCILIPGTITNDPTFPEKDEQYDKSSFEPISTQPASEISLIMRVFNETPLPREQLFGGKIDPVDPTHFSFTLDRGGQQWVRDYWFREVDSSGVLHIKESQHRIP
jgi:hypothetical protein